VRRTAVLPFEFRLKVVKLYLEDCYPATLNAEQFCSSKLTVGRWSRSYRAEGEQGLLAKERKPAGPKLSPAVTNKIVALKKENPGYGIRRITDTLKRYFLIRTSPSGPPSRTQKDLEEFIVPV
jgi:transposase